jgi:exopolysaccharide biosynthesis polyprenyl glycosylphosphotransferase
MLLVGLALAGYLVPGGIQPDEVMRFAPILAVVWITVFVACGVYGRAQWPLNLGTLLGAILSGMGLLAIAAIVYQGSRLSLQEILLATLLIVLSECGLGSLQERASELLFRHSVQSIPVLIIGELEERAGIRQAMEKNPGVHTCVGELNISGGTIDLPLVRQTLDRTGAQCVILAARTERFPRVQFQDLLHSMRLHNVKVRLFSDASFQTDDEHILFQDHIDGLLLKVGSPPLDSIQRVLKRTLDVAGSFGGLIVLSPLLVAVASLIKLTSPGPVFFRQPRVGTEEKVFSCYKFRSMYEDAETLLQRMLAEDDEMKEEYSNYYKLRNDPRITLVGHFIRSWSIDELPQLINILKGEMSLVGPRPLTLREVERMDELHKKRHAIIPGITGYWQISGRSDLSFEEMLRLDLYYMKNWSLYLDMRILLKTAMVVLRRDGAC